MLTEEQAHQSLTKAAATIDVGFWIEPPLRRRPRPSVALGAIAAVVVLVFGVIGVWAVMAGGPRDSVSPAETPTAVDSETAAPTVEPEEERGSAELAARAFAQLPYGEDVPWADEVRYSFAGEVVAVFDPSQASDPSNWAACPDWAWEVPEGSGPFMRVCPVSPFPVFDHLVGELGGELMYEEGIPSMLGCDLITPLEGYDASSAMTIRPDVDNRMCALDFAVMLYFDEGDDVTAVDIVLGSP